MRKYPRKLSVFLAIDDVVDALTGASIPRFNHPRVTHPRARLVRWQHQPQRPAEQFSEGNTQPARLFLGGLVFGFGKADLGPYHDDNRLRQFVIMCKGYWRALRLRL